MKKYCSPARLKRHVSLMVLVRVGLSNLATVIQLGPKLRSI